MKTTLFHAGYCTCPEFFALQGGRWRNIRFPALFVLFEHPRFGAMLFDTGYAYRFFAETQAFPNRLYRWTTPVTLREEDLAVNQLAARNLRPRDISRVFISHFHADHVAALKDFDRARFVYLPHAYARLRGARGLAALTQAFIAGLIPADFDARSAPVNLAAARALPSEYAPFTQGYDLLGDESMFGVELPGHAHGQMGLFVRDDDRTYFFVADAAWLKPAIEENRPPHRLADLLFPDPAAYRSALAKLHAYQQQHPGVQVIPSHGALTQAPSPT